MAKFTVRVELHDADWDDYVMLYERMAAQNFTDTITTNSEVLKMPPAEYNYDGNVTKEQILNKAKTAATGVGKSFAILVTESNGDRKWYNLEKVRQTA